MSGNNLGFGIIGCGMIANWHAQAIKKANGAELIGVSDINIEAGKAFAQTNNIHCFNSLDELLLSPKVNVVSICTPSGLHAQLAIQAANAGKHIVLEKPMAITVEECDKIIHACKNNNVKLTVISQLRFSDAVQKLKKAVDSNMLGRLVMGDVYMKYYRSPDYYESSNWKGTKRMDGGGALMNQGIHGIDLLLYIMGPVKSVFGHAKTLVRNIEVEDTASAILEFESGAIGVIQGTTSIYPGSPRRLEVNGEKGTIVLEEDSILSWKIEGQDHPEDIQTNPATVASSSNPAALDIHGHVKQISDMVDAIKNNKRPLVDQYEGRKPVELILAIYESSQTGNKIYL